MTAVKNPLSVCCLVVAFLLIGWAFFCGTEAAALPSRPDLKHEAIILPGEVPSPLNPPPGCRFHPRCSEAKPVCADEEPQLISVSPGHQVACHLG